MGGVALSAYLLFMVLAFGVRAVVHRRRTGSTGFRGLRPGAGLAEKLAGVLFVVAVVLGLVAPALQLFGVVTPVVDSWATRALGAVLAAAGIVATLFAQGTMGDSWRVGVDPAETTALVTGGPFALVRNPIFTAMTIAAVGLTLAAPNVVAIVGLAMLLAAVLLQVRVVEEPYLLRVHGEAYSTYGRRVGRLVPGVGRFGEKEA